MSMSGEIENVQREINKKEEALYKLAKEITKLEQREEELLKHVRDI